jgi:hypothetical protein
LLSFSSLPDTSDFPLAFSLSLPWLFWEAFFSFNLEKPFATKTAKIKTR